MPRVNRCLAWKDRMLLSSSEASVILPGTGPNTDQDTVDFAPIGMRFAEGVKGNKKASCLQLLKHMGSPRRTAALERERHPIVDDQNARLDRRVPREQQRRTCRRLLL